MGIVEFLWENSKILTEFKVKADAESRADEARRLLRAALASKFPGLQAMPELDQINKLAPFEDLFVHHVISGSTRVAVRRAIQKAPRQSLT